MASPQPTDPRIAASDPVAEVAPGGIRNRGRAALLLSVASVASGLAAYAYVVLGTHQYGASAFAPVGVTWSIWSAEVAVVTFPVQHWIIREMNVDPESGRLRRNLRLLATGVVLLAAALFLITWAARDSLFHRHSIVYPLLVPISLVGSFLVGVSRGSLVGRGRVGAMATSVAVDNVLRLAAAIAVVALGWDAPAFAMAIAVGFVVAFFWPSAFVFARGEHASSAQSFGRDFAAFVGASLIAQLLVNEGPVLVALLGRPDHEVTAMFAVFALGRAPMLVVGFASVVLTAEFSRWFVLGQVHAINRARAIIVSVTAAAAGLTALVAAAIGVQVIHAVFGSSVNTTAAIVASVAGGCVVALGALVLTLLLVSQHRSTSALGAALIGLAAGVPVIVFAPNRGSLSVAVAFLVAEVVTLALLAQQSRPTVPAQEAAATTATTTSR
jgi:O-antigen/teichoic acid export membrane protein